MPELREGLLRLRRPLQVRIVVEFWLVVGGSAVVGGGSGVVGDGSGVAGDGSEAAQ